MNSSLRSLLAAAALIPTAIVSASGCADNDSSIFISGVARVQPPTCTVRPNANTVMQLGGVLDISIASTYTAALIVGNQMAQRGDKSNLRSETSRVNLRGAEVRLENADGSVIQEFTVPGTGFATINQSQQPGYGVIGITVIPGSVAAGLSGEVPPFGGSKTVVANIRVFGDTLGGHELTSSELTYPVQVCNGCTIDYPPEAISEDGECIITGQSLGSNSTSCYLGQDGTTDCRRCRSFSDLCRCPPGAESSYCKNLN